MITSENHDLACLYIGTDSEAAQEISRLVQTIEHIRIGVVRAPDFSAASRLLSTLPRTVCLIDDELIRDNAHFLGEFRQVTNAAVPLVLLTSNNVSLFKTGSFPDGADDAIARKDLTKPVMERCLHQWFRTRDGHRGEAKGVSTSTFKSEGPYPKSPLLRLALDNTKHGIAMFDDHGRLIVHNNKYLSTYGFSADIVYPGVSIDDILDYSISLGNYSREEAARTRSEREVQIRSSSTSTYEQRLRDGRIIAVTHQPAASGRSVSTCEDITETLNRERVSASNARDAALADAANAAKSAFLANMSHELRTPLNAIIGFSQAMCEEWSGPLGNATYSDYAKAVFDGGGNLLRIVDQLLDMSLLADNAAKLQLDTFNLSELLGSKIAKSGFRVNEKNLTILLKGTENPIFMNGDASKIGRVFEYILDNAIKFSLAGKTVTVTVTTANDGALEICVCDNGIGIPAEKIKTIMSAFEQMESAYSREYHGIGLGLPIADGFVRLHGGKMSLESRISEGTTVTITFPPHCLTAAKPVEPKADGELLDITQEAYSDGSLKRAATGN